MSYVGTLREHALLQQEKSAREKRMRFGALMVGWIIAGVMGWKRVPIWWLFVLTLGFAIIHVFFYVNGGMQWQRQIGLIPQDPAVRFALAYVLGLVQVFIAYGLGYGARHLLKRRSS